MSLSVVELINRCGLENVRVQFLDESLSGAQRRKGGETEIKFLTSELSTTDVALGTGKVGMVVWLPRDKVEAIRKP